MSLPDETVKRQELCAPTHESVSVWPPALLYSFPLCAATSYCSCWIGLFPCSAFIDFSQTQRQTERKGLFRKKLNGQVASWGWLSPLYWRGGKMSLLWRLLQQIASWLDECPRVRVEHVSPAAKQDQIKGQGNPLELEARYLCTRTLFRQRFTGLYSMVQYFKFGLRDDLWHDPLSELPPVIWAFNILGTLIHKTHNRGRRERTQKMLKRAEQEHLMMNVHPVNTSV